MDRDDLTETGLLAMVGYLSFARARAATFVLKPLNR